MRQITIPELNFSCWYAWENRNQYSLINFPGVYQISISNKELEGTVPSFSDVVYIGMTKHQSLSSRLGQFNNSIMGGEGHGPAKRIYRNKGNYENWTEGLYVSAIGIECNVNDPQADDYLKMGQIAFLEYEAFAKFNNELGGHPKYNKQ